MRVGRIEFGREPFTKYDERDLLEILEPLDELKRAFKDNNIDPIKELSFVSPWTVRAVLSGKRNVIKKNNKVFMSPKWQVYLGRLLDREKVLISEQEQVVLAINKLFLSIYNLLENDIEYGLYLIQVAIRQCIKYGVYIYLDILRNCKNKFILVALEQKKHDVA